MDNREIDVLYRTYYSRLVTSLISYFGLSEIEIAEDIVHETFLKAIEQWKLQKPADPASWLFKVCKNNTINYLKKTALHEEKKSHFERQLHNNTYSIDQLFLSDELEDNQLRLLFACCHSELSARSQIILTLKILAGFKTEEIARGLGSNKDAIKKNLTRTKALIKEKGLQLKVPFILQSKKRLDNVHKVIYLIFNEGYNSTIGQKQIKTHLCFEAIRLLKMLMKHKSIHNSTSDALMALMLFNSARFPARETSEGMIIDLEDQNRDLWDSTLIQSGFHHLKLSKEKKVLSTYHIEAGIAAIHCSSISFYETDWCAILRYYEILTQLNSSPFVQLNKAIALSYCKGDSVAIQLLESKAFEDKLKDYYLYHVTLGKLYSHLSDSAKSKSHFLMGLQLTHVKSEQVYIRNLINQLD